MAALSHPALREAFLHEVRFGKYAGSLRRDDPDAMEHLHYGILAIMTSASATGGLSVPEGFWSRRDARPMLVRAFRHRLMDRYRRRRRRLQIISDAVVPKWFGAPYAPGPRAPSALLEECRRRLDDWLDQVDAAPAPCRSRRELAWILRSSAPEGPQAWQMRDPPAAARALDLLLKWKQRAEATLPARLFTETGPAVVLGLARAGRAAIAASRSHPSRGREGCWWYRSTPASGPSRSSGRSSAWRRDEGRATG